MELHASVADSFEFEVFRPEGRVGSSAATIGIVPGFCGETSVAWPGRGPAGESTITIVYAAYKNSVLALMDRRTFFALLTPINRSKPVTGMIR
jgi:hypothetical protein